MSALASDKQCSYINFLCAELQYTSFSPVARKDLTRKEASDWISELEEEYEEFQIMSDVLGIGQY